MNKKIQNLYKNGLLYDDLTDEQKKYFLIHLWNGVGSREYVLDPPDSIFSVPSIYHDFWYLRGGPIELRKLADLDFYYRCVYEVRKRPKWKRPFYHFLATVYYYGLKYLGKKAWDKYDVPIADWRDFVHRTSKYLN